MNFSSKITDKLNVIQPFSKNEILTIKTKISTLKKKESVSEESEETLDQLINNLFPLEQIELVIKYLEDLEPFSIEILCNTNKESNIDEYHYSYLKINLIKDLQNLNQNFSNFKINLRNISRFLKSDIIIESHSNKIEEILERLNNLMKKLEPLYDIENKSYENYSFLWFKLNIIKNSTLKITHNFNSLKNWNFYDDIYNYIINVYQSEKRKKKKKEKSQFPLIKLEKILNHLQGKGISDIFFISDLLYLLYKKHFIELISASDDAFEASILKKKEEILQKIIDIIEPNIKKRVFSEIQILNEKIRKLDKKSRENRFYEIIQDFNEDFLKKNSINDFFLLYTDNYLEYLERKYQERFDDLPEINDLKPFINSYYKEIDFLSEVLENIIEYLLKIEPILRPNDNLLNDYKKTIFNLEEDVSRKKEEFIAYIKTLRNEHIRSNIKEFVEDKIAEINNLTNQYQENVSSIVNKEFPELQRIRELLIKYGEAIKSIKLDVNSKIDQNKNRTINFHSIIKKWEENFALKKKQQYFLLSLFLNKLLKNFKVFLEQESSIFNKLEEIRFDEDFDNDLPLNHAMTELMTHFTDEELQERLVELKANINKFNKKAELYQQEYEKLEKYITERIKLKEGILKSDVKCGVCREEINLARDKIIKCPFCGAIYHYLCVAFWISKYNSCPSCQNKFLDPTSSLFDQS